MKTLALLALAAAGGLAQHNIVNANLKQQAATNLASDVKSLASSGDPVWIGWTVPRIAGHNQTCNGDVHLEEGWTSTRDSDEPGSGNLLVLLRAQNGAVQKVRAFGEGCRINAGGRAVHMLTAVKPSDSVAVLAPLAGSERKITDGVVMAVAMHADPAADAALERFLEPGQSDHLREQTTFWLGAGRGRRGYERLRKLVRDDSSARIREKAVFALYISKEPEAVDDIIDRAKNDQSSHVRGQALFWLAQKAGKKAAGAIGEALENDPDTEIKKKAVFALSQMHNGEGVPKLIEVARSHRNAAVRKQAFFWLGQSKDPRALSFFEEVLRR
jgi:hypothetical protein